MGLCLNFFDTPHLIPVHNQMSEFMRGVEARPRSIVLVATKHYDRVVRERQRESIYVRTAEGQANHDHTVLLQELNYVMNGPGRYLVIVTNLPGNLFDLCRVRIEGIDFESGHVDHRKLVRVRRGNREIVRNVRDSARPSAI